MKKFDLHILSHADLDIVEWDVFIRNSPQGSLFCLYEYASIISEDWQAVIVSKNGKWEAVMPFSLKSKWGFAYLLQPMFSQYWGVCFAANTYKGNHDRLSQQQQIMTLILENLPFTHVTIAQFSPACNFLLPFHWDGYELHTRYTFCLSLQNEESELWASLASQLRRQIKKSTRLDLVLHSSKDPQALLTLFEMNKEQGRDITGTHDPKAYIRLGNICKWLLSSRQGELLEIRDASGEVCAAGAFGYFEGKMMYLMGGFHPEMGQTGAMSLLMWEAIRLAKKKGLLEFDFEGSMIEGVAQFFRKFNATPVPYIQIRKNALPLYIKWIQELRS